MNIIVYILFQCLDVPVCLTNPSHRKDLCLLKLELFWCLQPQVVTAGLSVWKCPGNEREELLSWEQVCGQLFAVMSLFNKGASIPRGPHTLHGKRLSPIAAHSAFYFMSRKLPLGAANTQELLMNTSRACTRSTGKGSRATTTPQIKFSVCKDLKFDEDFTLLTG